MTKKCNKKFWVFFFVIIFLMLIMTLLMHRIYPNGLPVSIFIAYYGLHIISVISFFYYFKCMDVFLKSFHLNKDEIMSSLIVILFWLVLIIGSNPTIIRLFFEGFKWQIVFPIFAEELFFRIFIMGTLLYVLSFEKIPYFRIYIGDDKNSNFHILMVLFFSSFLFSIWHEEIFGERLLKGILMYGLSFILTNRKILPSLILHYCNNILV